jgi:hypothetical protein
VSIPRQSRGLYGRWLLLRGLIATDRNDSPARFTYFASDLHAGPTTPVAVLEKAFAHLRAFAPDVLILGGDYVLFEAACADELAPLIRSVVAPLGRYAVLGTHELWADDRAIARSLQRAEATLLVNRCVSLSCRPEVSLGGLDDAWAGDPGLRGGRPSGGGGSGSTWLRCTRRITFRASRAGGSPSPFAGTRTAARSRCRCRGPSTLPRRRWRRYLAGRYDLPGSPLWVSRGVGHAEVPWRWLAPADVLCATLRR